MILRGNRDTTQSIFKAIVLSSALFGAIHLVNLLAGANPAAVVLQVGYSFLIGAMCAFVLIKTGSVWHAALVHAVYNFCGGLIPTLGRAEKLWTAPQIILTAIVAVIVAVYVFVSLLKVKTEEADALFTCREKESEGSYGNI